MATNYFRAKTRLNLLVFLGEKDGKKATVLSNLKTIFERNRNGCKINTVEVEIIS